MKEIRKSITDKSVNIMKTVSRAIEKDSCSSSLCSVDKFKISSRVRFKGSKKL